MSFLAFLSRRDHWRGLVRTKWSSASRKEPSPETELCWNLDLGLPMLQNAEKMNFCCLSHVVSGVLLWLLELMKTGTIWHPRRGEVVRQRHCGVETRGGAQAVWRAQCKLVPMNLQWHQYSWHPEFLQPWLATWVHARDLVRGNTAKQPSLQPPDSDHRS